MANQTDPRVFDIDSFLDDITKADPLADAIGQKVRSLGKGLGLPATLANVLGATAAFSVYFTIVVFSLGIFTLVGIGGKLVTVFLRILTKFRTETVPEQIELSASVLSEFLATEITAEQLKSGKTGDQTIDAARGIGDALLNRLTKEFVPSGEVTPESGENAAKVFAGYGVNFAVQNTIISTLADATSFHFLEEFRELGVEVARNIGLGRLVRQALQPLVRNAISEPYDQALRKRYRPDKLSDQQYVRSWTRGNLDFNALRDLLAVKGFREEDIDRLIADLLPNLSDAEVSALIRFGDMTPDDGIKALAEAGIPAGLAQRKLRVNDISRIDTVIGLYKNLISKQRTDGLLTEEEYLKLLNRLPITDEEKQWELNYTGQILELPRSFLSWSEVTKAFETGIVDLDYVDRWLQREGFSDEDALNKELLLLQATDKFVSKEQAAADKAARKTTPKPQ